MVCAALHREDDRIEAGAGDAADRSLHGQRAGAANRLAAAAFPAGLHAGRYRAVGFGRRGARDLAMLRSMRRAANASVTSAILENLLGLDKPAQYLRQELSINALKRIAGAFSDTDAAACMQQAKSKLFEKLRFTA